MGLKSFSERTFSDRKGPYDDGINLVENPEEYMNVDQKRKEPRGGQYNPKNWSTRKRIVIGGLVSAAVILTVVLGAYFGVKANRYPDYSRLSYSLQDTYEGSNFFENFDYFTGYDPTQGFVHYVDAPGSAALNLTHATPSQATLRVDTSERNASTGRKSARITSKASYSPGNLFLFDIAHSPVGCGTWSALWLTDPSNWPDNGEIDVVESVNQGEGGNQVTLHTAEGCKVGGVRRKMTGEALGGGSCVNSTDGNAGCGVRGGEGTYGPEFNEAGGGVYAVELREEGIRTWFFPRDAIPEDITPARAEKGSRGRPEGGSPDPSSWGTALADFPNTDCDIGNHFRNQSIVVNIDLCGTLAGNPEIYSDRDECPGTCSDFVAGNPDAFRDAFWSFNSFRVYHRF